MPRTEEANQRIRDERRARILEGARVVFARKGLAATMADVAASAGVSQGLAYRYFAGKDELFRALLEESMRPGEGPRILESAGTPGERVERLVSTLVEGRRERPELFQILHHLVTDEATPADLLELVGRRGREFRSTLRQLIVEGQATGEVAAGDPDQLVAAVGACLDGLSRLALTLPEHDSAHYPDAEIIMRMLRNPGGHENLEGVTGREREVLCLVGSGLSNTEIAERLHLTVATVKSHVGRLLRKLQARDRAQLVIAAYEAGLVP